MLTLFLKFGARTRPQDLWQLLISAAGLKFLIWSQGEIRRGNQAQLKRPWKVYCLQWKWYL